MIVMDGRGAEQYEPLSKSRMGLELARVRTPDEAVSFVTRFGLLGTPATITIGAWPPGAPWPAGVVMREPFAVFERAAEDLRDILKTIVAVRKGADGDAAALARLRERFGPKNPNMDLTMHTSSGPRTVKARDVLPPDDFTPVDDRAVLVCASEWAAWGLHDGLFKADAHPYVFGTEIGGRLLSVTRAWTAAVLRSHGHAPAYTETANLTEESRAALAAIDLHFHDLRRECGSRWLEGGVPLHTIRDWLGHTNISQTSTYLTGTAQTQHDAMTRFEAYQAGVQRKSEQGGESGYRRLNGVKKHPIKPWVAVKRLSCDFSFGTEMSEVQILSPRPLFALRLATALQRRKATSRGVTFFRVLGPPWRPEIGLLAGNVGGFPAPSSRCALI